ncbi:T-cell-specific guanine nucleotide triphosphate-binding protein 1-like [Astyanax mexicanus]|uniref:T-cell-specific guanine nucleotide triphosphate-binding protein 1-like n=1 Tax=Astyanax mexicanus TaxID=7994 RepID=A0A8T2L260_ASTMX|nr:T-cell-specific guanine nucleotide triphosphate-binding protein 1-like [Astyanax mexicanus]
MTSQSSDTNEAIRSSGESTLEKAKKKAQEQIDHLFNVSLHIAVIGETGAGKSTFINAFRGLEDDDEGAAKTGVNETTAEPTPYNHPTMSNVTLWDLPGVGSLNFTARTYVKEMQFEKYDFFFIVSSERFRENDIMLAKEIQKGNKKFYFIRSKVDNDIRGEERKKTFDREETLSKIRRDCQENLNELGNPPVFLVNSWNLSEFDFEELVSTLNSELPEHKQFALLQSAPVTSVAMLEKKVDMFRKVIWAAAVTSGGIATVPVPGLSFLCDTVIVMTFFRRCYYAFGLDDESLKKLSERVNKPELISWEKSPLLKELAKTSMVRLGGSAAGEFLCSLVPVTGTHTAATMSFTMTRGVLENGLQELANEAKKVLTEAGLEKRTH